MKFKTARICFVLVLGSVITITTNAQRGLTRTRTQMNIDQEESLPVPKPPKPEPKETVEDRRNIGEFPYRRGETPIFNFDQGDEPFIQTIPDLIEGLHDMAASVKKQRQVTNAYAKVFLECNDCKP